MKKLLLLNALILAATTGFAQIPNGGFETWNTVSSYTVPDQWDNLNLMTSSMSTYTCMKGSTSAPAGSSYLQLVSKTTGSMGVMPGIVTCGMLEQSNMSNIVAKSGFAFTQRPQNLTGSWQYMAYGSDQGYISVLLTKWNMSTSMRDTVAYTRQNLSGMVMSWATFSITLSYMSTSVPDSCILVLSASGTTPVNNSYLYADNLAFAGSVPSGVANISNNSSDILVYPNPANSTTTISYNGHSERDITISVNDISGREITSMTPKATIGENKFPINVSGFAKGIYFIRVSDDQSNTVQKLVVE